MQDNAIESTLTTIKQDQVTFQEQIATIIVENDEQYAMASEVLCQVKARLKRVEQKRLEYTKPLNDQVKKMNADFKEAAAPYVEMELTIKGKIGAYVTEQRRKQEEAERQERLRRQEEARKLAESENISRQKAAAEIRKQHEEQEALVPKGPAQQTSVKTSTAKVVTKVVTKFEVIDPSKVPDEFKIVDERLIRIALSGGAKRIPGVKIWEDTQVSAF